MTAIVSCARCRREATALERAPVPGPVGDEVQERICADCWGEWSQMEVMVINELRLNFMDPKAQAVLKEHMREFLCLDGQEAQPFKPLGEEPEDAPG